MRAFDQIEVRWNLEIDLVERGKRRLWHQRTHNIIVNTGREFLARNITPQSLSPGTFVRYEDTCVRYIGFGMGGSRQTSPDANTSPLADLYPAGYEYGTPPHNSQTDNDVTVGIVERPVQVTTAPLWMREIVGDFSPTPRDARFIAIFGQTDINIDIGGGGGTFSSVPLSEIGLYKSTANPALPNGSIAAYPGASSHLIAYDTFNPVQKTGNFDIEVRWTWRF